MLAHGLQRPAQAAPWPREHRPLSPSLLPPCSNGVGDGGFVFKWKHASWPALLVIEKPFLATEDPAPDNLCQPGDACWTGDDGDTPVGNPVTCPAGRTPVATLAGGTTCELCPIGSYCPGGVVAPQPCAADTYQNATGSAACRPCPNYSFAYYPGAAGCIACYFGEPKVVAGNDDGFWPWRMPAEQAREGEPRGGALAAGVTGPAPCFCLLSFTFN